MMLPAAARSGRYWFMMLKGTYALVFVSSQPRIGAAIVGVPQIHARRVTEVEIHLGDLRQAGRQCLVDEVVVGRGVVGIVGQRIEVQDRLAERIDQGLRNDQAREADGRAIVLRAGL